jgi:RHS repeat-associated protein
MVSAYHPDLDESSVVTETVQQPLRFRARELDLITGLYYVRNRWYDPVANRFVSEDPIGLQGGINLYAYAGNSPTNFRDPFGLDRRGPLPSLNRQRRRLLVVCGRRRSGAVPPHRSG